MRINEIITEAFDKPYELEWDDTFGPKEIHARAYDRQGKYIDINFVPVRDNITDIEFSKMDSFDITNDQDAHRVFATVIEAIKRYLRGYQPKILEFSGKGASRGSLYQSLITRFAAQYGYKQFDPSKLSPEAQRQMGGTNVFILRKMTPVQETEDSIALAPTNGRATAKAWIEKVYAMYPQQWQNNHVMPMGGEGEDQQFALFELTPSLSKRGAVEVKWFQAYPLRQGVGSRAMKQLQSMAREDGIALTLFPWEHGQVSQSKLTKFYKGQGFKPVTKGSKSMSWEPTQVSEDDSIDEDLSRRGFLGALGGAAATAAVPGIANAGSKVQGQIQPRLKEPPVETTGLSMNASTEHALETAAIRAGIRGVELAQFMAQMRHESADFANLKEIGNKHYFAKRYDPKHAPRTAKILGNTHVGDGERYYGRGFVQITGRDNYRMAGEYLGIDLLNHPDWAARPDVAAKIAVWYWKTRVKPSVNNFNDTAAVTKLINPALRGLKDRAQYFKDYKMVML